MRLTGVCSSCSTQIIFETDTIEAKVHTCHCGTEVKLQNRYSDKNVSNILEANVTEEQEIKIARKEKREKKIIRKSLTGKKRGRPPKK